MNLAISILCLFVIVYSAFSGTRRGMILLGLELVSFTVATIAALSVYRPLGQYVQNMAHLSPSLSNMSALLTAWVVIEIASALLIRLVALPHLSRKIQLSIGNQLGGSVLGSIKAGALLTFSLIIFSNLPIPDGAKQTVTNAFIPKQLISASAQFQNQYTRSLGQDFTNSLNFFTITSEPENETRINLGYTTTKVQVDSKTEDAMLVLLNHERTSRGLNALTVNVKAREVARNYAKDMFARGYFSHINLEGKTPFDRMKAGGVEYHSAGENLALSPSLQQAHEGLMKSPAHRANILSRNFRAVGIGVIDGGPYGLMITQNFTD